MNVDHFVRTGTARMFDGILAQRVASPGGCTPDVPVDAFWSITVYNRDGFLEANEFDAYSLNRVTASPDEDGTVTIDRSPEANGYHNHLHVMDGWDYASRLYHRRPEILDGRWNARALERVARAGAGE